MPAPSSVLIQRLDPHPKDSTSLAKDAELIGHWIPQGAKVLDLGCGDGHLLEALIQSKGVIGRGIEIDEQRVRNALKKGLSVAHGDIMEVLDHYPDQCFDVVILNHTLQVVADPVGVLEAILRVGQKGIVGFPNFGHWRVRWDFISRGRMPSSRSLPFTWYDTPNIHLFTVDDFRDLITSKGYQCSAAAFGWGGQWRQSTWAHQMANILAEKAVFVLAQPPKRTPS